MSMNSTRRRVEMLLRNPRRRTSNLASLRRRTDAESFSSEMVGHSGVEWRTLGSVFNPGSATARAQVSQQQGDSPPRRTPVPNGQAHTPSAGAHSVSGIENSSLNRRDGD
jgi:hypothetical protein